VSIFGEFFRKWTNEDSETEIAEAQARLKRGEVLFQKLDENVQQEDVWDELVEIGYAQSYARGGNKLSYQETGRMDDDKDTSRMSPEQLTRRMNDGLMR